jgi:hypothetical protein
MRRGKFCNTSHKIRTQEKNMVYELLVTILAGVGRSEMHIFGLMVVC